MTTTETPAEIADAVLTLYTPSAPAPQARGPLGDEMMRQCRKECGDNYTKRGAFISGWIGAERAHGITADRGITAAAQSKG